VTREEHWQPWAPPGTNTSTNTNRPKVLYIVTSMAEFDNGQRNTGTEIDIGDLDSYCFPSSIYGFL
jgi:hypothetical protein